MDKYVLTTAEILTASPSGMTVSELVEMVNDDKERLSVATGKKVILLDVKGNKTLKV